MIDQYDKCTCKHFRFEHLLGTEGCARCFEKDDGCQHFDRQLTYRAFVGEILDENAKVVYVSRRMAGKLMELASPFTSLRFDGSSSFMGAVLQLDDSLGENQIAFDTGAAQRKVEFL